VSILCYALQIYVVILIARIIFSWFPISPGSPFESVADFLRMLTEPVLGPLRRAIPPVRMGAMALDLSPMIVLFGIQLFLVPIVCR
jgi:YggT family protein